MNTNGRTIRVFISSTFHDMQAEREELVKRVFPQLRKMCEERGVIFTDVDLRWGVTDEESAEGKVLPICLAEIERCRPFFIGLLGERYGWIPEHIPDELAEHQPWLLEHRQKSVTELEIIHGVLGNPAMGNRACFYFRDPVYIDSIPTGARPDYVETDPERRAKLEALKDEVRRSGLTVREGYATPEALGEMVLKDLTIAINQMYPQGPPPSPLDREAADHEAFARSRAGVYIGGRKYFDRLDAHAAGDGPPLVVLGESGSGKSALLANWAMRYREGHPDDLLITHFIGGTPSSADWAAMLRRILSEFQRRFAIRGEIPDKPDALRAAFANGLYMAAAQGRVVLILDALNQLEDRDQAPDLVWLPPEIPVNIRMVLSSLPGRPLQDLQRRGWPTVKVEPLDIEERELLITEYLGQYTKALSPARVERVATAAHTANPLYLRALLEELRLFGKHELLEQEINRYLTSGTVPELYEKILERYEKDYGRKRPALVRDAMTLLCAARYGLSETELLDLLGSNGDPLPQAIWSPLHLAVEQALVNRSGLNTFFHAYLRDAVRNRYLTEESREYEARLRLADYFDSRRDTERAVDELPWQLYATKEWERLRQTLTDITFVEAVYRREGTRLVQWWVDIIHATGCSPCDAYSTTWRNAIDQGIELHGVVTVLGNLGYPQVSEKILAAEVAFLRAHPDRRCVLATALLGYAQFFGARNDRSKAKALIEESISIYQELGEKLALARAQSDLAGLVMHEDPNEAMRLLKSVEETIILETGRSAPGVLGNQANVLDYMGHLDKAVELQKQATSLCAMAGDRLSESEHRDSLATYFRKMGNRQEALELLRTSEIEYERLGLFGAMGRCLGQQALILADAARMYEALKLNQRAETLLSRSGQAIWHATCVFTSAQICHTLGENEIGATKASEALQLLTQCGAPPDMVNTALQMRADFQSRLGNTSRARPGCIISIMILVILCIYLSDVLI